VELEMKVFPAENTLWQVKMIDPRFGRDFANYTLVLKGEQAIYFCAYYLDFNAVQNLFLTALQGFVQVPISQERILQYGYVPDSRPPQYYLKINGNLKFQGSRDAVLVKLDYWREQGGILAKDLTKIKKAIKKYRYSLISRNYKRYKKFYKIIKIKMNNLARKLDNFPADVQLQFYQLLQ
jgi:hypothetical protein